MQKLREIFARLLIVGASVDVFCSTHQGRGFSRLSRRSGDP